MCLKFGLLKKGVVDMKWLMSEQKPSSPHNQEVMSKWIVIGGIKKSN